jgi:hypothetical protein
MSTNIIVFQPPETKEISILKTETEILYERFEKQASIPGYHFKTFMEMEEFQKKKETVKTTIPSIMIKKILPYCTPIIKEIPDFTVKTKTVDIFSKKVAVERKQTYYNVSLQLDRPVKCIVENIKNVKSIVVSSDTMFFIIGIKLTKRISKCIDKSFPNFITSISNNELLSSGKYGLVDFQNGTYTQSRINGLNPDTGSESTIYFDNDNDANQKITKVLNYIKYLTNFYESNYMMVNNYLHQQPFTDYIKLQIDQYNLFYPEYNRKKQQIKEDSVIKFMEKLIRGKTYDNPFYNNFLFSISHVFDIYNKINMLGINHQSSKKFIQNFDTQVSYKKIQKDYNKVKFKKKLEFAKKQSISISKFHISELSKLTQSQHKVVDLEYKKQEKYYNSFQKHSDDFKLVNSLFWAMANDKPNLIQSRLKELEKTIKLPKNLDTADQIIQNSHKIHLICPHAIAKAKKMITPYKTDLLRSGKIREYLINTFSLPATTSGHYCRICGELLADSDDEEVAKYVSGKRVSFVMEIDPLKQQIWKDVVQIMTSYVKFKDAVNIKGLVTLMSDTLRPELGSIESNLIKIKSNTKDSIKNLMSIYTAIYTFAMVVHMINNNYGKITFTIRPPSKGGAPKKKKRVKKPRKKSPLIESDNEESEFMEFTSKILKKMEKSHTVLTKGGRVDPQEQKILQNIINNALYLILKTKNIVINNVTSISSESVKPILIKAYKWAATLKNADTVSNDDTNSYETTEYQMKYNNHVYSYLVFAHNMAEFYKNPDKSMKTPSVNAVLGRTWPTIEAGFKQDESLYSTAVIPALWDKSELTKYKYESFKSMMEYIKLKLYNKDAVPLSSSIKDHMDKYKILKIMEHNFYEQQKLARLRPFNNIEIHENLALVMNNFKPSNIHIEKYYDNNGIPHKFDIYVFQTSNAKGALIGTKKEYTKKDVIQWLGAQDMKKFKEFKYMFIVDERCSVCKTLRSQVKNKTVTKALEKLSNVKVFYQYYENRCPKGELHDFVINKNSKKDNYCKKCGLTENIFADKNTQYYNKYVSVYYKEQTKVIELSKNDLDDINKKIIVKHDKTKFPAWKVNNASILELSRTFKIKYNILINLGLSTNIKYKLIETEKINPSSSVNNEQLLIRNVYLFGYYLNVVRKYYLIKHYDTISFIPFDLKNIMSKNKTRDLNKKLPDVDKNTILQYNYYKEHESRVNLANFLLHSISRTLLTMYKNMKNAQMDSIAHDLIMYMIDSLIKSEKALSEPDVSKFVIQSFKADGVNSFDALDVGDDDDNYGNVSDVESVGDINDMVDEDPDDQFSTGNMDVEGNEENMEMNHGEF